ncbi:MAG: DUF421 domain-containing protein [Solirubrobacterales bacterium]
MVIASLGENLFHLHLAVEEKVLRSLLVFVFLVFALRLGGKRELAQLNVLDLAVLLLASNALQNAMIGDDNSVTGGVVGASALFAANYGFVRLTYRNRLARRLLEGEPLVLLDRGELKAEALRKEAITETELLSAALEKGFDKLGDVGLIVLETDGHLAVLGPKAAERWRQGQMMDPRSAA